MKADQENKWQPITTAPIDGTPFLGLSGWSIATYRITDRPETQKEITTGWWIFKKRKTVVEPAKGYYIEHIVDGGDVTLIMYGRFMRPVTHWMPLPLPPSDK